MNTSEANKTLGGVFPPRTSGPISPELRPDVVAKARGEIHFALCGNILRYGHGFVASTNLSEPKDASGNWIPLFTCPCVECLQQFDLSLKRVFE